MHTKTIWHIFFKLCRILLVVDILYEIQVLQVQDGWVHQLQPGKDLPMCLLDTLASFHSFNQ